MSIFSCHNKTSYCSFFNSTIEGHFSLSTFYELVQRIMEVIELSNKAFMGYFSRIFGVDFEYYALAVF